MSERCPRCGSALPAGRFAACPVCLLEAELAPVVLEGEIELGAEIGRGGMGVVYEALDRRLGRRVAVKLVSEELAARPELRERFQREARALARLRHPSLVAVHSFGEHEGRPYLVMEHAGGRTLAELLPLERERALEIASELCDALAHAHELGVVHRDLKPENVLVDEGGRARLTDFGLAGLLLEVGAERLTRSGAGLGTPHYTAPEALAGAPPDPRMDVYSLGALLYAMLRGRAPAGSFEPLEPDLDPLVRRALAQDPARRHASARAFGAELAALRARPLQRSADGELPPEEAVWLRAAALVASMATASALYAFYVSVVPRVLEPSDVQPLVMISERLPDGRIVAHARFETGPTLAALLAVALACGVYGALRHHWRRAGLLRREPERAPRESRVVLWLGCSACIVYVLRLALEDRAQRWVVGYVPLLGAAIEIAVVFLTWIAVFEAWRVARPLVRERRLWLGVALALIPPLYDLARYLRTWQPV